MLTVVLGVLLLVRQAQASCTFPSKFRGIWQPNDCSAILSNGGCQITITSSTVSGLSIQNGVDLQFECLKKEGNKYSIRSDLTSLFGYEVNIYICWEMMKIEEALIFYQHTKRVTTSSLKRGKAYLMAIEPDMEDCCDEQEGDASTVFLTRVG